MMSINDNKPDFDAMLKQRAAPPPVRENLAAQIINAAMSKNPAGSAPSDNVTWFRSTISRTMNIIKTPQGLGAVAACFALGVFLVSGITSAPLLSVDIKNNGQYVTAALDIDDIEVDVLYDWEDYYL